MTILNYLLDAQASGKDIYFREFPDAMDQPVLIDDVSENGELRISSQGIGQCIEQRIDVLLFDPKGDIIKRGIAIPCRIKYRGEEPSIFGELIVEG